MPSARGGARGELRVGDIASLPYEPASFDGVIDNEAVYCNSFDISRDIYADIARVLKPGGRLYSRTFATGSWGDGTGESVGKRTWRCTEGPLAGKGVSRFTAEEDIPVLLAPFDIDTLELLSWTFDSRQQQVREWIITAHSR